MAMWLFLVGSAFIAGMMTGVFLGLTAADREYRTRPAGRHEIPRPRTAVWTPLTEPPRRLREETDTGWIRRITEDAMAGRKHQVQWETPNALHSCKLWAGHPGPCECLCGQPQPRSDADPFWPDSLEVPEWIEEPE